MKQLQTAKLLFLVCLPAATLLAQPTIGGGSCTSASLSGTYAVSITGRQVTAAGNFTNVFQSVGSATFDGQSKVTISLTQDNSQTAGTPLTWSGSYSEQANCVGLITITSGGNPVLNVAVYSNGADFLITGSDATYSYSGSGNAQATGCSASTLQGVYAMTGTGFSLSSGTVNGAASLSGLMQFDGASHVTLNLTTAGAGTSAIGALTGSYSLSSSCVGSATLSDSTGKSYVLSISIYNTSANFAGFFLNLGQTGKFLISGAGHIIPPAASPGSSTAALRWNAEPVGQKGRA